MSDISARIRILPLLLLVALFAFAIRMGDAFLGVRDIAAGALAEQAALLDERPDGVEVAGGAGLSDEAGAGNDANNAAGAGSVLANLQANGAFEFMGLEPASGGQSAQESAANVGGAVGASGAGAGNSGGSDATLPEIWADPALENMADSPGQLQLFEDLSARREALDARERGILAREALLAATEKQIDEKLGELTDLRNQIEDLLGQQEAQEQERINSLVKIYEGMKARDAANIFNQMDMDILVQVVSRMSERKSAPILAAMDTTKANQLTVMLSEMDKLPAARTDFRGIAGGPVPTAAPMGSAPLPGLDALGIPQ